MPSYFDNIRSKMFGNGGQTQQQPNQQQDNNPDNQDPNNPQGNSDPTQGNNPNAKGNQNNPQGVDYLAELYTKKGQDPEAVPQFSLDDKNLEGLVNGQDFVGQMNPEDMQKLQSGDFSVLGNMINSAARKAYKAALQHGSTLTGKYSDARFEHYDKQFGSKVRNNSVQTALAGLPNYNKPAIKAHLNDIANRLSSQHPDASPQEIAQEAQRILMELANDVNPENTPEARKSKETQGQTDWSKWLAADNQMAQ